jgi:protein AroM
MAPVLGAVTIGQSPRVDVIPELAALLPGVAFREAGALDGEDPASLARLAERPAGHLLVTRLRDGSEIRIGEDDILPRVQRAVDALQGETEAILLLCTGPFPRLESAVPLLYPGRLLTHFVAGVFDGAALAVLAPAAAQVAWQETRWRASVGPEAEVIVEAASPYEDWQPGFEAALGRLVPRKPALVIMDCLGYDQTMRDLVRARTGVPAVLARSVLARAAAELLALDGGRRGPEEERC